MHLSAPPSPVVTHFKFTRKGTLLTTRCFRSFMRSFGLALAALSLSFFSVCHGYHEVIKKKGGSRVAEDAEAREEGRGGLLSRCVLPPRHSCMWSLTEELSLAVQGWSSA